MLADYFNNPLVPFKWYEVARTREKSLFKKVDVFMYLSMTHDNAFDLVYVSVDEINRRLTKCYHGKFKIRFKNNCLIIRHRLFWKRYYVIACDEAEGIVALSNRWKTKCWILSKNVPYDIGAFHNVMKGVEAQGVDVNSIELFYE